MADSPHSRPGDGATPSNAPAAAVWVALIAGGCLAVSWCLPHGWSVLVGATLVVVALCIFTPLEGRLPLVIALIILVTLTLVTVALPNISRITDKARNAELKANLHAIQLGLERYATDHDGAFPLTIDELRMLGYMPDLPMNPFSAYLTGSHRDEQRRELAMMQPLGADYHPMDVKANLSPVGNFCYLPRVETSPDGLPWVTGYSLIGIGNKDWHPTWLSPKQEIPIVLLQLNSWMDKPVWPH